METYHSRTDWFRVKRFSLGVDGNIAPMADKTLERSWLVEQIAAAGVDMAFLTPLDEEGSAYSAFHESLVDSHRLALPVEVEGTDYHMVGGTINWLGKSGGDGIQMLCLDKDILPDLIPGWDDMDGRSQIKLLSLGFQPSARGDLSQAIKVKAYVYEDSSQDGNIIVTDRFSKAFASKNLDPEIVKAVGGYGQSRAHKVAGSLATYAIKGVMHPLCKYDTLPEGVVYKDKAFHVDGQVVDVLLSTDCLKNKKSRPNVGSVISITDDDIRFHCDGNVNNYKKASASYSLFSLMNPVQASAMLAATAIGDDAELISKSVMGDAEALSTLVGAGVWEADTESDNFVRPDNYRDRNLVIKMLSVLKALKKEAGIFLYKDTYEPAMNIIRSAMMNRVLKAKVNGAMCFAAPSQEIGKHEIVVPTRSVPKDMRLPIRNGEDVFVMIARYPVAAPSCLQRVKIVGMSKNQDNIRVHPDLWMTDMRGDYDGDHCHVYFCDLPDWENMEYKHVLDSGVVDEVDLYQAMAEANSPIGPVTNKLFYWVIMTQLNGTYDRHLHQELFEGLLEKVLDAAKHGGAGMSADQFCEQYGVPKEGAHELIQLLKPKYDDSGQRIKADNELVSHFKTFKALDVDSGRTGIERFLYTVKSNLASFNGKAIVAKQDSYATLSKKAEKLFKERYGKVTKEMDGLHTEIMKSWKNAAHRRNELGDPHAYKAHDELMSIIFERETKQALKPVLLKILCDGLNPSRKTTTRFALDLVDPEILAEVLKD